ncbi:MAG: hypothetical protein CME71_09675 [Halobacteriovorax sp.]|nr:hypothetical protein [Halobacteriovorax sp.]
MDVIVLGQCKTIRSGYAVFQFSGYWRDQKIKQIRVSSSYCWQKEGEYILQLKVTRLEDKILWTRLIKAKLFD